MSAYSPQQHHVVLPELELDSTAIPVAWQAFDLHIHDAECPVSNPNHTPFQLNMRFNSSASSRNQAVHVSGPFLSNIMKTWKPARARKCSSTVPDCAVYIWNTAHPLNYVLPEMQGVLVSLTSTQSLCVACCPSWSPHLFHNLIFCTVWSTVEILLSFNPYLSVCGAGYEECQKSKNHSILHRVDLFPSTYYSDCWKKSLHKNQSLPSIEWAKRLLIW